MSVIRMVLASALAGASAAAPEGVPVISAVLMWSTALVWLTMALVLASVVGLVGRRSAGSDMGAAPERPAPPACCFRFARCCVFAGEGR